MFVSDYIHPAPRGTPDDPATFDLVTFSYCEPREVLRVDGWRKEIGSPNWKALIGERV